MTTSQAVMAPATMPQITVTRRSWIASACTLLLVAQLAASGVMMMVRPVAVLTLLRHLGYPDYFASLLGIAKVLGAVAIAMPRFATATEWAYAGATFDVLAASASHFAVGDAAAEGLEPLVILPLIAVSYLAFRARSGRAIRLHGIEETT